MMLAAPILNLSYSIKKDDITRHEKREDSDVVIHGDVDVDVHGARQPELFCPKGAKSFGDVTMPNLTAYQTNSPS
jgi:hypothetical protein